MFSSFLLTLFYIYGVLASEEACFISRIMLLSVIPPSLSFSLTRSLFDPPTLLGQTACSLFPHPQSTFFLFPFSSFSLLLSSPVLHSVKVIWWGKEKIFGWFWLFNQVVHFSNLFWELEVLLISRVKSAVLCPSDWELDMWGVLDRIWWFSCCLANHLQLSYSDSNLIAVCLIPSSTVAAVYSIILYRPVVCNCTKPGVEIGIIFVS